MESIWKKQEIQLLPKIHYNKNLLALLTTYNIYKKNRNQNLKENTNFSYENELGVFYFYL